jgi:hypothetical protein
MLATFFIEVFCAVYVIAKYRLTAVTRIAAALLIGLAVFQLAEFNVCVGAFGVDSLTWARIGYVAITALPPLGIHLMLTIAGVKNPWLVATGYISGLVFACIFLFVGQGMGAQQCLGNYVIFSIAPWSVIPYFIYYYGWLLVAVGYSLYLGSRLKKRNQKIALYCLAVGYAAFIVPTTAVNIMDPSTIAGIPSIMCGFAVILAIILTGFVIPRYYFPIKQSRRK